MIAEPQGWKTTSERVQHDLFNKIPTEWRLKDEFLDPKQLNVTAVPETCGILSSAELEITSNDATGILAKIHSGQWSAEKVCLAFCKRAAIAQQLVNCLTEICFDEALAAARSQDTSFKSAGVPLGPLHGLPVSIKDHVDVKGLRTTLGYCSWADNLALEDAVTVTALKKTGAIVFVKTTMPVTGMALETVSNLFGRTTCPYNRSLAAGGSSGGDGALVAMRGTPIGMGTDVAGSVRVPCAFNGIYGIRPSTRKLSYAGVATSRKGARGIAAAIGPMCNSVRDAELIYKVLIDQEPWKHDATVIPMPWNVNYKAPAKLVIGIMEFDGVVMPHPPIRRAIREAADKLKAAGHEVFQFRPLDHDKAWEIAFPLYYATAAKEIKSNIAATGEPWFPAIEKIHADPCIASELTASQLYDLQAAQDAYKQAYLKHWNDTAMSTTMGRPIDALLCPVNPCASFPHDTLTPWCYSAQWNLLDYPGVVLPVGFVDKAIDLPDTKYQPIDEQDRENHEMYDASTWHNGPISLQLIGRQFCDEQLLAISEVVDQAINHSCGKPTQVES